MEQGAGARRQAEVMAYGTQNASKVHIDRALALPLQVATALRTGLDFDLWSCCDSFSLRKAIPLGEPTPALLSLTRTA